MDTFSIKKNDKNPALSVTLQYSDGTPVDLTSGTVYFIMGERNYSPHFSGTAAVIEAGSGVCEYRWTGSPDTETVGTFWGEFEVNWTGSKMTLPSDHSLQIKVFEDYN